MTSIPGLGGGIGRGRGRGLDIDGIMDIFEANFASSPYSFMSAPDPSLLGHGVGSTTLAAPLSNNTPSAPPIHTHTPPRYDFSNLNGNQGKSDSEEEEEESALDLSTTTRGRHQQKKKGGGHPLLPTPTCVVNRPISNFERYSCSSGIHGEEVNATRRVFASGLLLQTPLASINNFAHKRLLQDGLENCEIKEFNALQRMMVPHLYRGDDIFIIGGSPSGRKRQPQALTYIIPMIGALLISRGGRDDLDRYFNIRYPASNPSLIIICPDVVSANRVNGHIFSLLHPLSQRHIAYDAVVEHRDLIKLKIGLTVVSITVSLFLEMMEKNPNFIGFGDLRYLVYEDIDGLLAAYPKEFESVQNIMNHIGAANGTFYQRIFSGQKWTQSAEDLYNSVLPLSSGGSTRDSREKRKEMKELKKKGMPPPPGSAPTLFIYSANQLIQYAQVAWHFHHAHDDQEKIGRLKELLKSVAMYEHKTIFILCSTAEVAISVYNDLDEPGLGSLSLAETKTLRVNMFNQLNTEWSKCQTEHQQIMVLNDEALMRLSIRNVTCLIHYDLPLPTNATRISTRGAERFVCMWDNIRCIALEKATPSIHYKRRQLESHFLLLGTEPVVPQLRRFGANLLHSGIPESLNFMADQIEQEAMESKPFCTRWKIFGYCVEQNCKFRHVFLYPEVATEPTIPRSGWVEILVAESINPSQYTGRVLRVYGLSKKGGSKRVLISSWIHQWNEMEECLKAYFSYFQNDEGQKQSCRRIPPPSYEPGSLCVVENSMGLSRARILQIVTRSENHYPKSLRVYCIDTGYFSNPQVDFVYALPDQLNTSRKPQLGLEIVLANLSSTDCGASYSGKATSIAAEVTENKILHGQVQFAMGDTAWVFPLYNEGRPESGVGPSSIRLELIKRGIAQNNSMHLSEIQRLGRDTGFTCPELEESDNPMRDAGFMSQFYNLEYCPPPNWAFVPTNQDYDKVRSVEIWGTYTRDPYTIYGSLRKFADLLDALIDELDDAIQGHIGERCSKYATQFEAWYTPGLVVAVKDRYTKKWMRGLITRGLKSASNDATGGEECTYDVFFVDIGDTQYDSRTQELFPMPRKYVEKLPFQSICFRLNHISPVVVENWNEPWSRDAVDKLLNLTLEEDSGVLFDIVAFEDLDQAAGGVPYYHAVILINGGRDVGEMMVQEGFAQYNPGGEEMVIRVRTSLLRQVNAKYDRILGRERDPVDDALYEEEEEGEIVDNYDDNGGGGGGGDLDDGGGIYDIVGFDSLQQTLELGLGVELPPGLGAEVLKLPTLPDKKKAPQASTSKRQSNSKIEKKKATPASGGAKKEIIGGFQPFRQPTVLWSQTPEHLRLHVDLPAVKDITLDLLNPRTISFRTVKPPGFGFDLKCPGALIFSSVEEEMRPDHKGVTVYGQHVDIRIKKKVAWLWPRIVSEGGKKLHWLKEDLNVKERDEEEERKRKKEEEEEMKKLDKNGLTKFQTTLFTRLQEAGVHRRMLREKHQLQEQQRRDEDDSSDDDIGEKYVE